MTRKAPIQIEGLDELRKDLRRLKDKGIDESLKATHEALAKEITARALPKVPVLSGDLKGTVRASGTVRDAIGRAGTKSVPYAPPIHWGWAARGIPPRRFLQDAAAELEADIAARYDADMARILDRYIESRSNPHMETTK